MRNHQFLIGLTLAASLGFGLGSCSSSSSSSTTNDGSTSNGDGSTSTGNGLMCPPGGSTGSCTQAELDTYDNCLIAQCGSMIATCYGSGYQSGSFSGPCASYGTCTSKCSCTDSACRTACGTPSGACSTCVQTIGTCALSSTCTIPACLITGGGTGGTSGGAGGHVGGTGGSAGGLGGASGSGTCADLMVCCNAATNATVKSTCLTDYTMLMASGDAACGAFLSGVKSTICP